MSVFIVDTHPLVWYFDSSSQLLPERVRHVLRDGDDALVIPSIVICELLFLARKGRFEFDVGLFRDVINEDRRFSIHPLDERIAFGLVPHLEMHDAIIVGTAQHWLAKGENVAILTKDREIAAQAPCQVVWE